MAGGTGRWLICVWWFWRGARVLCGPASGLVSEVMSHHARIATALLLVVIVVVSLLFGAKYLVLLFLVFLAWTIRYIIWWKFSKSKGSFLSFLSGGPEPPWRKG